MRLKRWCVHYSSTNKLTVLQPDQRNLIVRTGQLYDSREYCVSNWLLSHFVNQHDTRIGISQRIRFMVRHIVIKLLK